MLYLETISAFEAGFQFGGPTIKVGESTWLPKTFSSGGFRGGSSVRSASSHGRGYVVCLGSTLYSHSEAKSSSSL